ncbi:MAG: hypothetical protein AB9880_03330 [Christensenellales bacterium]
METLHQVGRRMLFWGALLLIMWAAYEFSTRVDAMSGPLVMYFNMAVGEKVGLAAALKYVDWQIFSAPAFLLGCVLLGLLALLSRGRSLLGFLVVPLCVLAVLYTAGAKVFFSPDLWSLLKLLPLLLIALGSLVNLGLRFYLKKRRRQVAGSVQPGGRRFQP